MIIFAVLVVLGLALIFGNLGDGDSPDASALVASSAPLVSEQEEPEKSVAEPEEELEEESIHLDWRIPGDYGKTITLNAGTPDEYSYIGFFLPLGPMRC